MSGWSANAWWIHWSTKGAGEIRHKILWTSSAWAHRTGLARFDQAAPHQTAKLALRSAILAPTFAVWTCPIDQLPVPWYETRARLGAVSKRS